MTPGSPTIFGDDPRMQALMPFLSGMDPTGGAAMPPPPTPYQPHLVAPPSHPVLEAIAAALGQVPMFTPERNRFGAYPSVLSRIAGIALPALAHGVGAGVEASTKRDDTQAALANRAEEARTTAMNTSLTHGYAAGILGRYSLAGKEAAAAPKMVTADEGMERQTNGVLRRGEPYPESLVRALIGAPTSTVQTDQGPVTGRSSDVLRYLKPGAPTATVNTSQGPVTAPASSVLSFLKPAGGGGGGAGGAGALSDADVKLLGHAHATGQLPPDWTGYGRAGAGKVKAAALREGMDVTKATLDYKSAQKFYASLNSPGIIKANANFNNADAAVDLLAEKSAAFSKVAPRFSARPLNSLSQAIIINGGGGQAAANALAELQAQALTTRTQLAQVYMGGGAGTDQANREAIKAVDLRLAAGALAAQLNVAKRDIAIRRHALSSVGATSPSNAPGASAGGVTIGARTVPTAGEVGTVKPWVRDPRTGKLVQQGP